MTASQGQEGSWVLFQYPNHLLILLSFKKASILHNQFRFQSTLYHKGSALNRKLGDWFQESDILMYFPLTSQVLNLCNETWASVRDNWEAEQAAGQKRAWPSIWCNQVTELKKSVVQQTSWDPLVTHSPHTTQRYPTMQTRWVLVRDVTARHIWMDGA